MNKQDAAKLLSIIKLSYPTAYRDIDSETANATVNMWAMSFPDVPYQIMEQGLNHYRMTHKFPPTVAEMVEELWRIHYEATECALVQKGMGNMEAVAQYKRIMDYTWRYKDETNLGCLNMGRLQGLLGGGQDDAFTRPPGDRMLHENRVPFLDAGRD